jgi:adenylosuccinate synthase
MLIRVVIGANFGDEGKGQMTNYIASSLPSYKKSLTILHNGGAQRGHTVELRDGRRHVFHHFGAGTYAGSDTFFAKEFILNPIIFHKEYDELDRELEDMNDIHIFCDASCRITTPFDMILNQMMEEKRGADKHGSCGLGIYETITRCHWTEDPSFKLTMNDIFYLYEDPNIIRNKLTNIKYGYFMKKIRKNNLQDIYKEKWKDIVSDDNLIENFIFDLRFMRSKIDIVDDYRVADNYDELIFENGQGLLLDQNNNAYYPHLTPSNTGSDNVIEFVKDLIEMEDYFHSGGIIVELCYITRSYMTRHGAGRFDTEIPKEKIGYEVIDKTNVPNKFQDTLRYGTLEISDLINRIDTDRRKWKELEDKIHVKTSVVFTHLEETGRNLITPDGNEPYDETKMFQRFNASPIDNFHTLYSFMKKEK